MVEKKGASRLNVLVIFVLFFAVLHTTSHIFIFGTGVDGIVKGGVSGFSIGELNLGDDVELQAKKASPISRIIIVFEWIVLIGLIIFGMIRTRIHVAPEKVIDSTHVRHSKIAGRTDLDDLYEFLQKEKSVSLSKIQKVFGVSKETVDIWSKTLESGNLVEIHYPHIGEPELRVVEK